MIVETRALSKTYGTGQAAVPALRGIQISIAAGEFVAVMGPSGCGKSTLLHLIGGLDRPDSGEVLIAGQAIAGLPDDDLARLRRRTIGFVFQFYNLLPVLSALENAALPMILDGMRPAAARERAGEWLQRVGLTDQLQRRPSQLSGGQQQRVAIARAMAADPALVLADEPTGNLDSQSAEAIATLLRQTAGDWGRAVLMVTHDPRIAAYADRIIFLKDGTVVDDTRLAAVPLAV
ncbi:MAG TPA: ABC transporter ATP-binding protein [Roseiflexaceae bacterium]|nr:ABC transporter ATP-binding protein [Roseiflexaceae bacterium]HMP40935.1 ABC transporter ATP-binding protein [Roseiflexaceae bacterium]